MKKNNRMLISLPYLKKVLIILASLILVLAISILVTTEIINLQPDSVQQSIGEKFNDIKNHLEFKGLAASIKDLTEDYSKLFDGYSNIIITDDNGNILYSLNDGYISEKNKFSVLVDPWKANGYGSNIAYLIDSKNNIKYSAQLDIALNMSKLKESSSRNSMAGMLYSKTQEAFDITSDRQVTNSDGTNFIISAESNIIMNYEYIASKGLNLYSLYDSEHQYNNYYLFTNSISLLRHWLTISGSALLAIFWVLLTIWVLLDARRRQLKAPVWALATFLFNIIALGIYLLFRPKNLKCRSCKRNLENDWLLCPYCGEKVENED